MDQLIRVKVLVLAPSRDSFMAGLPVRQDAFRPGVGRLGSDDGFWNPQATAQIRSASKAMPDGGYLLIGLADGTEGTIVFLAKHGT